MHYDHDVEALKSMSGKTSFFAWLALGLALAIWAVSLCPGFL